MNKSLLPNKAHKELENAQARAAQDEKAAQIAKRTARAAKLRLKDARKLAKLMKKAARKA